MTLDNELFTHVFYNNGVTGPEIKRSFFGNYEYDGVGHNGHPSKRMGIDVWREPFTFEKRGIGMWRTPLASQIAKPLGRRQASLREISQQIRRDEQDLQALK